jgi:hypothetical protein
MAAAGLSHWWSLRQFITVMDAEAPVARVHAAAAKTGSSPPVTAGTAAAVPAHQPQAAASTVAAPEPGQQQFYEKMLSRMESLQTQNRDLLDQLAETNRDLMKLEFRVDTHSESFRPLPVSEDRPFTHIDQEPGVLPLRAEPVQVPDYE